MNFKVLLIALTTMSATFAGTPRTLAVFYRQAIIAPPYSWDMATTTNPSLSSTDDLEVQVELPWPFPFFDETFRYVLPFRQV